MTEAETEVTVINPALTTRQPKGMFQGVQGTKIQGGQGLPLTGTRNTVTEDSGSSLAQLFACGRRFLERRKKFLLGTDVSVKLWLNCG